MIPIATWIVGDGVAASCCAHLIIDAQVEKRGRGNVPALLIGEPTQRLIGDVFGRALDGAARVTRRVVAWGENAVPVELAHSASVIGEQELNRQLAVQAPEAAGEVDWTIYTSRPLPDGVVERGFGSRIASASAIRLREGIFTDACWIESLDRGWLFLLPGWLLAVGASADELLAKSRVVAEQIESIDPPKGSFPAYPRICDPLSDGKWLACGSAAMAFDPICGDGVGNAIREAILASAVVKAAIRGENLDALREHYRTRLLAGFLKHLELCRQFYAAPSGDWWRSELEQLDQGIAWCRERLSAAPPYRYQLRGFELESATNEHE